MDDGESTTDADNVEDTLRPRGHAPSLAEGDAVGRYTILSLIGAGGMGEVYRARDPELERDIAIKVLQPSVGGTSLAARMRFLREAQALAQLNHPNVVAVYDVGTVEDQVFVAMELVDGVPLSEWLRVARPWREIRDVMAAAGRGLAAAHARGVVHRDFKPHNVMVGASRVVVLDFGLARRGDDLIELSPGSGSSGASLEVPLTHTGDLLGTPVYMAPEQLEAGKPANERSDQFSFCVTLYEALFGERPFAGNSLAAQMQARRERLSAPRRHGRPRWLAAVALRGLALDPAQRFPSMEALLRALGHEARTGRLAAMVAAGVAVAGAAALLLRPSVKPCGDAEGRWEQAWNAGQRRTGQAAFAASGRPYAAGTWRAIEQHLDGYGRAWIAARTDACEATRVRGEQSEAMLDRRMVCLDRAWEATRAMGELLARATPETVERALDALQTLPNVEGCNGRALLVGEPDPPAAGQAAEVVALRRRLADAGARAHAGERVSFDELLAAARQLGYRPLEGDVLYDQGYAQLARVELEAARRSFHEAVLVGEAASYDRLVGLALLGLINVTGGHLNRFEEFDELVRRAEAIVHRLGDDPNLAAALLQRRATVAKVRGDADAALDLSHKAAELYARLPGRTIELAAALRLEGNCLNDVGRYDEARQALSRALALVEGSTGAEHPALAAVLQGLASTEYLASRYSQAHDYAQRAIALSGDVPTTAFSLETDANVLYRWGRFDEAAAAHERAIAFLERAPGSYAMGRAQLHSDLGDDYRELGRLKDADASYARGIELVTRASGPEAADLALLLQSRAEIARREGRLADATASLERALALLANGGPSRNYDRALVLMSQGNVLRDMKRYADAEKRYSEALARMTEAVGADISDVDVVLIEQAELHARQGRLDEARAELERALRIREAELGPDGLRLAEPLRALANVLLRLGDRARAQAALDRAAALAVSRDGGAAPRPAPP